MRKGVDVDRISINIPKSKRMAVAVFVLATVLSIVVIGGYYGIVKGIERVNTLSNKVAELENGKDAVLRIVDDSYNSFLKIYKAILTKKPQIDIGLAKRIASAVVMADIKYGYAGIGVSANLILAIIETESDFNPAAMSVANAFGLMQCQVGTALDQHINDPEINSENIMLYLKDPAWNIITGTKALVAKFAEARAMIASGKWKVIIDGARRFDWFQYGLLAYNFGGSGVSRCISESGEKWLLTTQYVSTVEKKAEEWKTLLYGESISEQF